MEIKPYRRNIHYLLSHRDKYETQRPEEKRSILDVQPMFFNKNKNRSYLPNLPLSLLLVLGGLFAAIYFITDHTNNQARNALKALDDRISVHSSTNLVKTNSSHRPYQRKY